MAESGLPEHDIFGAGPKTIYLLHGGYGSKDYWANERDILVDAGYRVIAWNAPGYGKQPLPEEPYTIEYIAKCFCALVEATSNGPSAILGHSMGAIIAPCAFRMMPSIADVIILSASVGSFDQMTDEFQAEFLRSRVDPLPDTGQAGELAISVVRAMMRKGVFTEPMQHVVHHVSQTPAKTFKSAIRAIATYRGGYGALEAITVPTLCIAGELDDTGLPSEMKKMSDAIPNSQFVCVEGVGHYGWAESPAEYNKHLLQFLADNF